MAKTYLVKKDRLWDFIMGTLEQKNVRSDVASHVAESLIQTSLRGVDSHGIRLLPHYIRAIDSGRINPQPNYSVTRNFPSAGKLDADNTFGHAAGGEAMIKACKMASENGIGCISVFNSTHFGAASYFSLLAAEKGFIGISFTHADSLMKSYRGKRAFFGTNPICFAAPCEDEDPFCLDMATTLANWNKIIQYRERSEQLPDGWAYDKEGFETTNPDKAATLAPIGGYKGFGLSMMIEILCSLLTGMPFGRDLTRMYSDPIEKKRFLGHFFMAINIEAFEDQGIFKSRLKELMEAVRKEPPLEPSLKVLVPGDPEKEQLLIRTKSGIPIDAQTFNSFKELSEQLHIEFRAE